MRRARIAQAGPGSGRPGSRLETVNAVVQDLRRVCAGPGWREALVRSFASVPRAGAGAEIRLSASQAVSRAGLGLVGGDGLGVGVSVDELGDGGAVPPPRTRITAL